MSSYLFENETEDISKYVCKYHTNGKQQNQLQNGT